MRPMLTLTFALATLPVAAQDNDPDNRVAGTTLPSGWSARPDRGTLENVNFRAMGDGWHFTVGPAAIYWQSGSTAEGNFTIATTMTQTTAPRHPEAYGIFVGGRNLEGDNQAYYYFLVRKDGQFLVRHRGGSQTHPVAGSAWTAHSAVVAADSAGRQTNTMAVTQHNGTLEFRINDQVVWSAPVAVTETNGIYGYRVNHNLDIHAAGITKS